MVIWFSLSIVVAVAYAGQGACSKRLLESYSDDWVRWLLFTVAAPILAVYLIARGLPTVDPRFWPVLGIACVLGYASFWLFMRALSLTDLSIAYPLISLTPLFMVPVEFALLGDLPGVLGFAGIGGVVAGVYTLNLTPARRSPLDPFRAVFSDRGARTALALAGVWGVAGVIDKIAIEYSSPAFYAPAMAAGIAALSTPAAFLRPRRRRAGPPATSGPADGATERSERPTAGERPPTSQRPLGSQRRLEGQRRLAPLTVLHGLLFAIMIVAQYEALRLTLVSYVIAVKRTGAVLGVVLGRRYFREPQFGYRLAGAVIIVAGLLLLALA